MFKFGQSYLLKLADIDKLHSELVDLSLGLIILHGCGVVCLSVCWSPVWAVLKRPNRSWCFWGVDSRGPKEPCTRWWAQGTMYQVGKRRGLLWVIFSMLRLACGRHSQPYSLGDSGNVASGYQTGALLANKTEATGIVIIARWPLENNLNVWWAQVLHTEI